MTQRHKELSLDTFLEPKEMAKGCYQC